MARTSITPQKATGAGLILATEPANAAGNSFRPANGRVLHVLNGSGASVTVTIPTPGTVNGLTVADRTVAVPAGKQAAIALGPSAGLHAQADGSVNVDYSATTTVTVAVIDG